MAKQCRNYIPNDGYTFPGFIEAKEGLYDDLRFTFRPMLPETQNTEEAKLSRLDEPKQTRYRASLMAGRLTDWDAKDDKGVPLAVTQANVLRLPVALFWQLFGVLWGTKATDIDPNWSEETKDEEVTVATDATAATAAGAARDGAAVGNSVAG